MTHSSRERLIQKEMGVLRHSGRWASCDIYITLDISITLALIRMVAMARTRIQSQMTHSSRVAHDSLDPQEKLECKNTYGVASVSRIDKIVGLFAKEPYKRDDILQKRPII